MTPGTKICPFCKEEIREAAVKCRFCGEWLESGVLTDRSKLEAQSMQPGNAVSPSDVPCGSVVTNQQIESAAETETPAAPAAKNDKSDPGNDSWTDYWYGNLYMMLCVYLAYCAVTHLIGAVSRLSSDVAVEAVSSAVTTILLQTSALIFFGYVTYTLSRHRVKMGAIYTVALLSGIGMLFGTPGFILIWIALCPMAIFGLLRHKKAEELLKTARQMETDGKIQEALATYREVADSRTAVASEGRRSLESLETKVGPGLCDALSAGGQIQ